MDGSTVSLEPRDLEATSASTQVAEATLVPPAATPVLAAPGAAGARLAAVSPRAAARTQIQALATQLVPRLQYQIMRLGPSGQAGLAALLAAAVFAASTLLPARHALDTLGAEIMRAQHPATVQGPEQAAPRLVESLPTRKQIPGVIGVMYTQAKASNVALDVGHYVYSPPKAGALARYDVEFPVKASYPDLRSFINKTLTAVPAAALSRLHVERKTVGDAQVNANIAFVVFVRSE